MGAIHMTTFELMGHPKHIAPIRRFGMVCAPSSVYSLHNRSPLVVYRCTNVQTYMLTVFSHLDRRPAQENIHDPPFCFLGCNSLFVNGSNTGTVDSKNRGNFLVSLAWYMPKDQLRDPARKKSSNLLSKTFSV